MVNRIGAVVILTIFAVAIWILWSGLSQPKPGGGSGSFQDGGSGGSVSPPPGSREVIVAPSGLAIPVTGITPKELTDTFTQARAGGARIHDAIDIMAAEGTPVVAAADGRIEKLFFSRGGGGISVYVRSNDGRWIYYYAHLRDYAPGLNEGDRVSRGGLVGFVGYTGNASPDGPHLHFAIHYMRPGERWHEGRAINPYPLLAGAGASR